MLRNSTLAPGKHDADYSFRSNMSVSFKGYHAGNPFVKVYSVKSDDLFLKPIENRGDNNDSIEEESEVYISCESHNFEEDDVVVAMRKLELVENKKATQMCCMYPLDNATYTKGVLLTRKDGLHYAFRNEFAKDRQDGRIEYTGYDALSKQRGAFTYIIKQIGVTLFSGQSIMSISLPVDIFEPRSILERNAALIGFAPLFIERAANLQGNPLEQMKLAIAYMTARLHMSIEQRKPFNPILGETYQGYVDGYQCYFEQISHHPPTFAFQYPRPNYTLEGQFEMGASASPNSLRGLMLGLEKIIFHKTGNYILARIPQAQIDGIAFGRRYIHWVSKAVFLDPVNRLYARIVFDPDRKLGLFTRRKNLRDYFEGQIYQVSQEFVQRKLEMIKTKGGFKLKARNTDLPAQPLATVKGSWLEQLLINDQEYWNIKTIRPYRLVDAKFPLPSDSTYRLDLLYLKKGDMPRAQKTKDEMENWQRNDKKLRKAHKD